MRWGVSLGLALSLAACRQTVVFDQTGLDGGGGGGGSGGSAMCSGPLTEVEPEWPEVIVALDRSSGMSTRFGDTTPLMATRDALEQFAARYQKVVRYGYVEFPGPGTQCGPQCSSCPGDVSPPNPNFEAFRVDLRACDQSCSDGGSQSLRPLAPTLLNAGYAFSRSDTGMQRSILLVTNGRPDCGAGPTTGCSDARNAVNALASGMGIRTRVVAPGQFDFDTTDCFQRLALAGGASKSPYYYPASNPGDLSATLDDITHDIARDACQLDIISMSPITDNATVLWKNSKIPQNHSDGWELTRQGFEIVLHGQWCENLIADGPADLAVFATCNPPHP